MMQLAPANLPVRQLSSELFTYGIVSLLALALDTSVLWGLVHWARWHYLPASFVGFVCGAALAYLLSVRYVFRSRSIDNRPLEFGYFVGLGCAGLIVNAVALSAGIAAAGLGLVTAKMLAAGCTFATNFTLRRQLLFSAPGEPR